MFHVNVGDEFVLPNKTTKIKLISLSIRSTSTYVSCLAGYGLHTSNVLFAEKFYGLLK